jgi:GTP pyrophosphokinase
LQTAIILAKLGMRSKTIAAGLLHDVPEDTAVSLEEIQKQFGEEIAFLVDGVTKLGKLKLRGEKEEGYLENLRKMFLAMSSDIRVIIIKLADRLHNMRTLEFNPPDKQQRIARETMDILVPLANRLGMGEIKTELEDLSFKFLDKENYLLIKKLREREAKHYKKYIERATVEIRKELLRENVKVSDIFGRTKSIFRIFEKMKKHDMDIKKIYDIIGIRVIVSDVSDCYRALGIIHKKFHPLVGRIKDYISLPKPNGYQSIHTTIFGPEGKILEAQIRTQLMEDEAEFGIASHWIYSEKKLDFRDLFFEKNVKVPDKELLWVKQLRDWQKSLGKDDEEFMESLRVDFLQNHIFAFTPTGDIINLPEGSTPIDFAYRVHSDIGNRTVGAKANGKIIPIDYEIKNGDVVEIITAKNAKKPSRDWLKFVKTSGARGHIKKFYKDLTL